MIILSKKQAGKRLHRCRLSSWVSRPPDYAAKASAFFLPNSSAVQTLTAIIEKEDQAYVALCPELDIASQGDSIEQALANVSDGTTLIFKAGSNNTFGAPSLTLNRPLILKGVNATIRPL